MLLRTVLPMHTFSEEKQLTPDLQLSVNMLPIYTYIGINHSPYFQKPLCLIAKKNPILIKATPGMSAATGETHHGQEMK